MFGKYLVTGATGFLGRAVLNELIGKGADIRALVMWHDPIESELPPGKASGFPEGPKWVGTMSGARLMSQMMIPQMVSVSTRKMTSKILSFVVRTTLSLIPLIYFFIFLLHFWGVGFSSWVDVWPYAEPR